MLKFYLFGPPRLQWNGQNIEVSLRKGLALLVYLVATRRPHSRDALATLFWPEGSQRGARANLRRLLYDLNQSLDVALLETSGDRVGLHADLPVWIDVAEFQACAAREVSAGSIDALTTAAELYSDDFLAGFTLPDCPQFDDWQFFQRDALRREYDELLAHLEQYFEKQQQFGDAAHYARRRLALDPLEESIHQQLMALYAQAGQRGAALRQYEECMRLLNTELGVEPEPETIALYEAIRQKRFPAPEQSAAAQAVASDWATETPALLPAAASAPDSAATLPTALPVTLPHNLPAHVTPFIGRKVEVAEVLRRLFDPACRLLTLVGPGGIGKTRLAIEAGLALAQSPAARETMRDGLFFVALQTTDTPDEMAVAIAGALGISLFGGSSPQAQIQNYLRDKQLLLILDNFEHLLAGADAVVALLAAAPHIKLMVTSRVALKLYEEWFHPLTGLRLPPPILPDNRDEVAAYDAAQLFIQTARRANVDFQPDAEYEPIVRICRAVDGLPLAIELAAAWRKTLSCLEIATEIEQGLDILTTHYQNIPERHRSMQVVFDHTWRILTAEEQEVFQRLTVFQGGFTHRAAQQVAGAALPVLLDLVEKSLLIREPQGRLQIHDLLRQYADRKMAEDEEERSRTRDQHCEYYTHLIWNLTPDLKGKAQRQAVDAMETELDNLRTAWQWALLQGRVHVLRQAMQGFIIFFHSKSRYEEAEKFFGEAGRVLAGYLQAGSPQVEYSQEVQDFSTAAPAWEQETRQLLCTLYVYQAWFLIHLRHLDRAADVLQSSRLLQDAEDPFIYTDYLADPALPAGILAYWRSDYDEIHHWGEEALQNSMAQHNLWNRQVAHYLLSRANRLQGNNEQALNHGQQALAIAEELGDLWFLAFCHEELGLTLLTCRDYQRAQEHYLAGEKLCLQSGDLAGLARNINGTSMLALEQGDYEQAQELFARGLAAHRQILSAGGMAVSLRGLGNAAMAMGDYPAALRHFQEALELMQKTQGLRVLLGLLVDIARLLLTLGDHERGVRLLNDVFQHPRADQQIRRNVEELLAQQQALPPLLAPVEPAGDTTSTLADTLGSILAALTLHLHTLLPDQIPAPDQTSVPVESESSA